MVNQDASLRTTTHEEGQDQSETIVSFQESGKGRLVWKYIFVVSLFMVVTILAFFAGSNFMPQGLCYKEYKLK